MADEKGKVCAKCGYLNTKYHDKCLKCGQDLPESKETPTWIWWLVGVAAVIILWLLFK